MSDNEQDDSSRLWCKNPLGTGCTVNISHGMRPWHGWMIHYPRVLAITRRLWVITPPADPAFHTIGAMIGAAIQLVAPFQPTDPALDARAPVVATPEPPLLLMCPPWPT